MGFVARHKFTGSDCLRDAIAWFVAYRHLTKSPIKNWMCDLRTWCDGDMVLMSLPFGIVGLPSRACLLMRWI